MSANSGSRRISFPLLLRLARTYQLADIEPVGPGKAQQEVGRHRALVPLEQGDVAGRHREVARHRLLGQPQFAAQPAQARAEIEGAILAHGALVLTTPTCALVIAAQLYKE